MAPTAAPTPVPAKRALCEPQVAGGGRLAPLDGLRGLAVGLVVVDHASMGIAGMPTSGLLFNLLTACGALGVNIFFALSGFLITTLLVRERARTGALDLRRFYLRRTQRIFPAYYAMLAVAVVLGLVHASRALRPADILVDALYLHNFGLGDTWNWYTGHSWSLCIEEQFYLVWPAIVLLGAVASQRFAIAAIVLAPVVRAAFYVAVPAHREYIAILLPTRIDNLMYGCLLALVLARTPALAAWFTRARIRIAVPAAFVVLAASLLASARFRGLYDLTIGFAVTGVCVAAILIAIVTAPESGAARAFAQPVLVWFGRISYSVYLWQQFFLTPFHGAPLQTFPLNLVATVAAAAASYYLIERRFFRPQPVRTERFRSVA